MELSHSCEFQFPMPTHLQLEVTSGKVAISLLTGLYSEADAPQRYLGCMPNLIPPQKMQLMGRRWPQSHSLLCWQRLAEPWETLGAGSGTAQQNQGCPSAALLGIGVASQVTSHSHQTNAVQGLVPQTQSGITEPQGHLAWEKVDRN